jgi:hypothetical protein
MRKLVIVLLLGVSAASSVQAGDRKNSLRDALEFCNQFVITHPDPLDYRRGCCINAPGRWCDETVSAPAVSASFRS